MLNVKTDGVHHQILIKLRMLFLKIGMILFGNGLTCSGYTGNRVFIQEKV